MAQLSIGDAITGRVWRITLRHEDPILTVMERAIDNCRASVLIEGQSPALVFSCSTDVSRKIKDEAARTREALGTARFRGETCDSFHGVPIVIVSEKMLT